MPRANAKFRLAAGSPAALLFLALLTAPGCTWLAGVGSDNSGLAQGKTWFVGGAGSIGNVVGTLDVPRGLRQGGYRGAIEVFAWQSVVGDAIRDQLDRPRNEEQARRLATAIEEYQNQYPGRPVNIVALSAGTGIAAWALEALPPGRRVQTVVFLASSLSKGFDLTPALARVEGNLYAFHSERDPLLRYGLFVTGSVDREFDHAAGLVGFELPTGADDRTQALYAAKLRNRPYQEKWADYGYYGLHADSTAPDFIAHVVAPLLQGSTRRR